MTRRSIVASAPTRIDLAGGTIDIWPLSRLVPDAVTVNLAIELRTSVSLEPRQDGQLVVISRDRRRRASRALPLSSERSTGPLSWLFRLAGAFDLGRGATLITHARAPAGAGLGGSSALGIAVAGALARRAGVSLSGDRLVTRVMNLETAELGVPTGNQDYLAARWGGLAAYHHRVDGTEREAIAPPPGLEERLVLAYAGEPRHSGYSNWDMFRRFIDGDRRTVERMRSIARIASAMRDALVQGDLEAAGRLLGEEGRLRARLAPTVETRGLARAAAAARRAGALGTKICGAGGGGCLVAFARRGRTEDVARALMIAGARVLPLRAASRGLVVSER